MTAGRASSGGDGKKKPATRKRTSAAKSSGSKRASGSKAPAKKSAPKKSAAKKSAAKKTAEEPEQLESAPESELAAAEAVEEAQVAEVVTEQTDDAPDVDRESEAVCAPAPVDRMIAFYLASQRYAVPIDDVQEIQQIVAFSEVPATSGAVVGMINLRGTVIPALDVRSLIGLPAQEYDVETPMVICRVHGQLVALIVDEVEDVLAIPEGCFQEPPAMHNLASKMLGVCRMENDLVYLLDVAALVAPAELGGEVNSRD